MKFATVPCCCCPPCGSCDWDGADDLATFAEDEMGEGCAAASSAAIWTTARTSGAWSARVDYTPAYACDTMVPCQSGAIDSMMRAIGFTIPSGGQTVNVSYAARVLANVLGADGLSVSITKCCPAPTLVWSDTLVGTSPGGDNCLTEEVSDTDSVALDAGHYVAQIEYLGAAGDFPATDGGYGEFELDLTDDNIQSGCAEE